MLFAEELSLRADLTVRCPHFALPTAIPARNGHLGSKGSSMSWPGTLGGRNPTPPWTSYHLLYMALYYLKQDSKPLAQYELKACLEGLAAAPASPAGKAYRRAAVGLQQALQSKAPQDVRLSSSVGRSALNGGGGHGRGTEIPFLR